MDDRTAKIDQLLCTHCTYATSFLHQSTTHVKDQVFENSARAGSVERAQSHEAFRRIAALLNYQLPNDAPHQALVENDARTLPKRLIYHPAYNGARMVGQVSYRRYDVNKRRAGAYFAHVLLQTSGEMSRGPQGRPPSQPAPAKVEIEWSAREAALMWGWPQWIEEDDTEPNAKPFHNVSERFPKLPTPELRSETWHTLDPAVRVGDETLTAFLEAERDKEPAWIPDRWKNVGANVRQKLLVELLHGFLKLKVEARDCFLIGIEPPLAALLFFGVARLLPRRGPAEQLSFSTCEPQNLRPPFAMAATHSYLNAPFTLADDPRYCTLALNTFQAGWEDTKTARNLGLTETSYAQAIVNLYVHSGPTAVDSFLQSIDDEAVHPQPPNAADLSDLLAAEAYGRWVTGSQCPTGQPAPPNTTSGKRYVAAIVQASVSLLQGERLSNPARWRPLLQILAETDKSVCNGNNPSDEHPRKRLAADLLSRIANHPHPVEAEECLKAATLPVEWQAQLIVQLIQGDKPLPTGAEDFWKGRFAAHSGRQKLLVMIADRLMEQGGAEGLDRLLRRYGAWLIQQPEHPANLSLLQSHATVLQMLCDLASKHPTSDATVQLQRLVNQFLAKNPRWHDELLNRIHWSMEQTKSVMELYADRSKQSAGLPAIESPFADYVLRDLNAFPCPPPGTNSAPNSDSWLEFLECAERVFQLGHESQISAWKNLRKLLGDFAAHWTSKPSAWVPSSAADWNARLHEFGENIRETLWTAVQLEHGSDANARAAWERLARLQQSVNPSFKWDYKGAEDALADRFCKEVYRTLREMKQYDAHRVQMEIVRSNWISSINLKWVIPAATAVLFIPIGVVVVRTLLKTSPVTAIVQVDPQTAGKSSPAGNLEPDNPMPTKEKQDTTPAKPAGKFSASDEEPLFSQLEEPEKPHLIYLTRRLINDNKSAFVQNFEKSFSPDRFASLPSVRWTILSPVRFGTPQEALQKIGADDQRRKKLQDEGLSKLLIANPAVAEAVGAAIKALPEPTPGDFGYFADTILQELPDNDDLRLRWESARESCKDKPNQRKKFDQRIMETILRACRKDTKPDRLQMLFDAPKDEIPSPRVTLKNVKECAKQIVDKLADKVTNAETDRLTKLITKRNELLLKPPTDFVDLPASGSKEVTCPVRIDGICIHGIEQVNLHLKKRSSESAKLDEPFWDKDDQGRWGVVVKYGAAKVLVVTPDENRPTHVTISTSSTSTPKLPHQFLQMLVVEVYGRPADEAAVDSPSVHWIVLYNPAPIIADNVSKLDSSPSSEPNPLLEFLYMESPWKGELKMDVSIGSRPATRVDPITLSSTDAKRPERMSAWNVDGVYPRPYDAKKGKADNKALEEHPLLKHYQDKRKEYDDAPSDKKPSVPKVPLTPALDLLSRGTATMVISVNEERQLQLELILDDKWPDHPYVKECELLRKESAPRVDKGIDKGKPNAELERLMDGLAKDHANPTTKQALESAENYLYGRAKNPILGIRCIASLGWTDSKSSTLAGESKEMWLERVKKEGELTPEWLKRVKEDIQERIRSINIELKSVESVMNDAKKLADSLKVSCEVTGYREIPDPDDDKTRMIRIPLSGKTAK